MAMSMIVERIYRGETAAQIGITAQQYDSRKETLDRYLRQSSGRFEPGDYLRWLAADETGARGDSGGAWQHTSRPASGRHAPVKCRACGGGKIR
ncbi:hypothetical protein [Syntrophotalea acetylenica]|uniref:Uncharacterized protein n=1 Tax=Syntrophotalea acetylenica TaxID=29542 RepID=A0A1L3GE56_SYNAC|nr:hypothetical protein [Syntrophotalea acetylenica]APG24109.1 hypothetical protein A7E75_02975 [Syntrophotalea acetylenica]APG44691.1 hypothetical protein A6070_11600 [Syntrophotalea acetylenica]APG45464.1 hypothetical protein A6070_14790 [Syntrophotalea acetylenica]